MKTIAQRVFVLAAALTLAVPMQAIAQDHHATVQLDGLKWSAPAVYAPGAQVAVVRGDPSKEGMYVVRLKVPAGFKIAAHSHPWLASEAAATALTPQGNVPAEASKRFYVAPTSVAAMAPQGCGPTGGSQPHTNFQPYLCIDFIISLFGIFPSQT